MGLKVRQKGSSILSRSPVGVMCPGQRPWSSIALAAGLVFVFLSFGPLPSYAQSVLFVDNESPVAIPDGTGSVTRTITIPGDAAVADLNVGVTITHPKVVDLEVSVIAPSGQRVILHNRAASSEPDLVVVYDTDRAPAEPLANLVGVSSYGEWQLEVADCLVNEATGLFEGWFIEMEPIEVSYTPTPSPLPTYPVVFDRHSSFTLDADLQDLAVADVNSDGLPDILTAHGQGGFLRLHLGDLGKVVSRPQPVSRWHLPAPFQSWI